SIASIEQLLQQIPVIKLHNYAYKNNGGLAFENVTDKWGLELPTFSNGAVYADLDNDGDLEMVINNINDPALLYKNTSREKTSTKNHYLQVSFKGDEMNRQESGHGWRSFIRVGTRPMKTPLTGDICPVFLGLLILDWERLKSWIL
ncbi:MAG TPA: VCBS repeat-containing protein, partial [Sphingobacteriaceae bacterium]